MAKRKNSTLFDTADVIGGTPGNDSLVGTAGNDTINGGGGHDEIEGLGGNDRLFGDGGHDVITGGGGTDRLEGGGGDDILYGDDGNRGDTLVGGLGDDYYEIDRGDVVIEAAGEGSDTLGVNFSYTLANGSAIEGLQTFYEGVDLTGNSGDNRLFSIGGNSELRGKAGDDYLFVEQGEGNLLFGNVGNDWLVADTGYASGVLRGGLGDDSYVLFNMEENSTIQVIENAGEGTDTVYSYWNATLRDNLENLVLLDPFLSADGSVLEGRGNQLANRIVSQTDDDYSADLYGMGGNDYLQGQDGVGTHFYGGGGRDQFYLSSELTWGWDDERHQTIHDFKHGTDEILLDSEEFANIGPDGALAANAFYSASGAGAVAQTADHRVIYDSDSGALYYDPDGTGAQEQTLFVYLGDQSIGGLDATDIVVV